MNVSEGSFTSAQYLQQAARAGLIPASGVTPVGPAGRPAQAVALGAASGKTPGQIARDKELSFGVRTLTPQTQALLRAEQREALAQRYAQRNASNIKMYEGQLATAKPDVLEVIQKKGLAPMIVQRRIGAVVETTPDVLGIEHDLQYKASARYLKNLGWSKYPLPVPVRRSEELWVKKDASGNITDYGTFDELETKEVKATARAPYIEAARLRLASGSGSVSASDQARINAIAEAQYAEQAGLSGYPDKVKYWGMAVAVGLFVYALWSSRK